MGIGGGIVGGLVLAAGFFLVEFVRFGVDWHGLLGNALFVSLVASFYGAAYGMVLGPVLGWTLLRSAPIWRAIGETSLAATLAVGVTLAVSSGPWFLLTPVLAAVGAALRLRSEVAKAKGREATPLIAG